MNFTHCLHIVLVIGMYTDVSRVIFSSGGGGSGRIFPWRYYSWGRECFMKGVSNFSALLKNNKKLNKKKTDFFSWK